jgi:hypothetical protein
MKQDLFICILHVILHATLTKIHTTAITLADVCDITAFLHVEVYVKSFLSRVCHILLFKLSMKGRYTLQIMIA